MENLDQRVYGYEPATSQLAALREENARLEQRVRNLEGAHTLGTALIQSLTRERGEARAEARTAEASRRAHIERCEDFQRELARLEGLILDWRKASYLGSPDEYQVAAVALEAEALRIRAQREEEPEVWRCEGCGETFDSPRHSHGKAAHAPGCDGSCRSCPVEVECGPIRAQREVRPQ